ncbi:hypothetical protein ATI61_11825 [Archangium gephyra]|uniref:Uncharacterized protein n=2 Tax=Archangium gephyra TaxID=48 RepID=A0ABX9JMY7_9BACT|nr:hypothetical protein ATI61_11825 [Archangium gephyra]
MQYALDPRLFPPGGVPVQCTRCRHVFIVTPPAQAAAPAPQSTQVFGAVQPPRPAAQPNLNATLLFGEDKAGTPSTSSTQVFGAVPQVAPMAPVAHKPQGPAAGTPPSAMTTQVFGAVPQVAPMAPVAHKPQGPAAGAPPSAMTTQVFGAVPQVAPMAPVAKPAPAAKPPAAAKPAAPTAAKPAPAAKPPPAAKPAPAAKTPAGAAPPIATGTQVFGAVPQPQAQPQQPTPSTAQFLVLGTELPEPQAAPRPQPARPPSASKTPPFGSNPQMAPVARPAAGPAPTGTTQVFGAVTEPPPVAAHPPGMLPRAPSRETPAVPAPRTPAAEPMVAVAAHTPIELPEEILEQLNRPIDELRAEASAENKASAVGAPGPSKPLELPLEMLEQAVESVNNPGGRKKRPEPGGKNRALFIAGGVLVLLLTAFLTSPAWRTKTHAIAPEARAARDEALVLLKRDDSASKEEALTRLKALSAANPQSVELLAEVGIALATHLDDTQVRVATLRKKVEGLKTELARLRLNQRPANWQGLANTMGEELSKQEQILLPLEERAAVLSKEAVQVLKQLSAAPEEEEPEPALERLRARAFMTGVMGGGDAPGMAVKLAQAGLRDWSSLTLAEYVLNSASPVEGNVEQAYKAVVAMREADNTRLRASMLEARIALLRKDPATARTAVDTVITLNPKHELAQQLHAYAEELEKQAAEPVTTPVPEPQDTPEFVPAPEEETPPAPTPEANPAPEGNPATEASPAP